MKFSEVLTIRNGRNQKQVENPNGKYPIYGSGGVMGRSDDYICEAETVIIGRKGSINNPIYVDEPFWNVDTAFGLVANTDILLPKYLYWFCKHFDFNTLNTTVTIPSLTKSNLLNIEISVPTIDEQKEIADALDIIVNAIDIKEKQIAELDELVKSKFIEMFGDPATNPMGWEVLTFRQAGVRLSDGPFGSNLKTEHYTDKGVRVIRLGNIGVGEFLDDDKAYISYEHYEKLKKYTCRAGEIVVGTLGVPNLRACLVPQEIEFVVNKSDCVHYIPKSDILDVRFVLQYINCPETLFLASGMLHGQTRTRISSGQLAEMPLFIPPLELQKKYATFHKGIEQAKGVVRKQIADLQELLEKKMDEYFN